MIARIGANPRGPTLDAEVTPPRARCGAGCGRRSSSRCTVAPEPEAATSLETGQPAAETKAGVFLRELRKVRGLLPGIEAHPCERRKDRDRVSVAVVPDAGMEKAVQRSRGLSEIIQSRHGGSFPGASMRWPTL